jgi:hypothetical protein
VLKGNFNFRHSMQRHAAHRHEKSHLYRTVVINATTGKITDLGGSDRPPDLTPLGEIITDHPRS